MTKRGVLSVNMDFLADRLGLPKDVRIIGAQMEPMGFSLQLYLRGDSLPSVDDPGQSSPPVMLQMHRVDDNEARVSSIFGSWFHDPEKKWLIEKQPIETLPADFKFLSDEAGNAA